MTEFLHYWSSSQLAADWEGRTLNYIASNQLDRVKPGDRVWIVSFARGRLMLMGRIVAEVVTTRRRAARLLGKKPSELWDAEWVVLARAGTAGIVRSDLDISDSAPQLRFEGGSPRLPSGFNHHHLRSMRVLAPQSAGLLETLWEQQSSGLPHAVELDEELAAYEGELRQLVIQHRTRERRLRSKKIEAVLASTGALRCEVPGCGFDFELTYGPIGRGYAHVHHLAPLSSTGPRLTELQDLAIVCANCHAMIHAGGECRELEQVVVHNGRSNVLSAGWA